MEKGEACQIIHSQLRGIGHDDTIWSGDSDFIANGGIIGKGDGDGRG